MDFSKTSCTFRLNISELGRLFMPNPILAPL